MTDQITYYLSLQSPWTWLGHDRLCAMASRHGVGIDLRAVDFGAVFAQSGGLPLPKRAPQRQAYRLVELERWRTRHDVPLNIHPKFFPAAESLAAHVVTAVTMSGGNAEKLAGLILKAVWADDRDIGDETTLRQIISEAGLDAEELITAAAAPETEEAWQQNTARAKDDGVFGAPSYIYKGEMFWGQDRLEFLESKLVEEAGI